MVSGTTIAQQTEISIEKYQMKNICYNPYEISHGKSFLRYYKFTFHSYNSVFENYRLFNEYDNMMHIETDLYKLNYSNPISNYSYLDKSPKVITNKKTIEIVLDEDDMKKLYQSNSATLVFNSDLFGSDYYGLARPWDRNYPIPVISLSLNKSDFDYELAECDKKYNIYNEEYEEYHSKPTNRLKSFFGL
ncbi:MAG: hypothetical protein ABJG28_01965 [Nonlabens ulvanivorans]|uniref:hypothetical protein n=1 Tax=Nonlabens ulvanivorans TaxID=906888 RepID=UPI0032656169